MSQSSSKDDTEHQANARQTAKTALQKMFDRMVTSRPIREGKPVTQSGLKRTQHRDLRAAIRRTQTRVEFEDRRIEENKKAAEAGLTTDDLLQLDRKRLKKETETCKFKKTAKKCKILSKDFSSQGEGL